MANLDYFSSEDEKCWMRQDDVYYGEMRIMHVQTVFDYKTKVLSARLLFPFVCYVTSCPAYLFDDSRKKVHDLLRDCWEFVKTNRNKVFVEHLKEIGYGADYHSFDDGYDWLDYDEEKYLKWLESAN